MHTRQCASTRAAAWYPGNLQGRHFGESGPKGAHLVTLESGGGSPPDVRFEELAPIRWETIPITGLEDAGNLAALVTVIRGAFEARVGSEAGKRDWMVRFELNGECALADELRRPQALEELEEDLRERLGVLAVEIRAVRLVPPLDIEEHRGSPHLLGLALGLLDEAGVDDALLERMAPERLAGSPGDDDATRRRYLRDLLEGGDHSLVERFTR